MKAAVIGGTGFVGSYVVDALLDAGHEPHLLVRSGSEDKVHRASECRITKGNLDSSDAIDSVVSGCDAAIYLVGILREAPSQGVTFEALQYRGAEAVAEAAKRAGVRRFLLMSANGIDSAETPYQTTKLRAEAMIRESGLDYTIFRPSIIFGDPRGTMEFATQLHRDMVRIPLPAIGFHTGLTPAHGEVLMSPVHVRDVADAFANALADDSTIGKCFVLGGPEVVSWPQMVQRIAAAVGRKKFILPMPIGLMKLGATLFDWLPFFPVTRDQLTMLADGNTAEPDELAQLIGRKPAEFSPDNLDYLDG
ncbi:MAG TPA: NAD(P)H-binding protein [Woeseiaceae bacterium]|nr:NAD(P)H-binding protein [Woeseiaceae bacterium]